MGKAQKLTRRGLLAGAAAVVAGSVLPTPTPLRFSAMRPMQVYGKSPAMVMDQLGGLRPGPLFSFGPPPPYANSSLWQIGWTDADEARSSA